MYRDHYKIFFQLLTSVTYPTSLQLQGMLSVDNFLKVILNVLLTGCMLASPRLLHCVHTIIQCVFVIIHGLKEM